MQTRRWVNQSQPQTLVIGVFLLYFEAVSIVLGFLLYGRIGIFGLLLIGAHVAAGYGIANERKWAWHLGIALSVLALLPFLYRVLPFLPLPTLLRSFLSYFGGGLLALLFGGAQLALLVHPQSRDHGRIWFR
ncbi:MAG: hypothetical protein AVDCRST_MAG50-1826 [uncultured Acidimicrobiales bacterium]|uniref:Uncharacterized protein n=1 Tax=uncultured Acidimicrobiales bacterium TaxID=310071 RepID=A0A6J4I709_9ACTN|nr:MAG: hypothetical protein AVDCRST_MAG50-1826 [uncultured Acidimicrobiales bacterium]